ncbi:AMP-binding protein [Halovivax sp.]|uniref:class I adenylate-forming enzyme family protein n=1 Tax=Halovivax sp. TaxID=1935978 RepID=UPI0025BCEB0D|nr:AMP-binding protein [Halovivax sp.]
MTLSIHPRADQYGPRVAVVDSVASETQREDGDETISYADLAARADAHAARLADRGVGEGDAVCVVSRNRPELLGLFYGCLEVGAVLAPISHRLPADAAATLRERIDPALTLYEERFAGLVGGGDGASSRTEADSTDAGPVEDLDAFAADEPSADPDDLNRVDRDPDRPVLYLHTGGTTGVPKVVVLPYRQVEWNCITEVAAWGLGKGDVSPVLLPLFHTGGWNLLTLPTLYVGGRVVLHREFDPDEALAGIEAEGATHVFGVAAIFQAMAASERFEETDFATVDWFMSGGGPTPAEVFEAYEARGQRFSQGYGLTEGGPNNLYLDPDREVAPETRRASVGRPFPDCETRIVDADGEPVAPGEVGELEIRGPMTAAGYLETEDGTFDGGWVSTGDLARVDENGDHYITGRTDNMFVSGGENVYPEEIEDPLSRHEAVADVGVVGVPHEKWGTVPKAVVEPVEPDDGATDGIDDPFEGLGEELEAYCRERLADFQVPHAFEFVEELPASGPGKLDRGELEARYGDGGGADADTDDAADVEDDGRGSVDDDSGGAGA